MKIIDGLIMELQEERKSAREVISRIPDDKWDWKPHDKSMGLGQLASHIVETFDWVNSIFDTEVFEFDMANYNPYVSGSRDELLAAFDEKLDAAIDVMSKQSDADVMVNWKMVVDGHVMMEMPRIMVTRMFMVSHLIHHRGQLSVYLRLNDIPVPSIYGPSADEDPTG